MKDSYEKIKMNLNDNKQVIFIGLPCQIAGLKLYLGKEYDNLYESALARQKADWLVGINGTRLFTVLYNGKMLRVGRVQTPTLAMLVDRETEIMDFMSSFA